MSNFYLWRMNKNRDDELSLRECQFNTWCYLINWLIQSVNILSVFGTWIQFEENQSRQWIISFPSSYPSNNYNQNKM